MSEAKPVAKLALTHESMLEILTDWENQRLAKIAPKDANGEFAVVSQRIREIGIRCGQRYTAEYSTKCAACHKPLPAQGPANTVPIFDDKSGQFVNRYACSAKCSQKLTDEAAKRSAELQAQT